MNTHTMNTTISLTEQELAHVLAGLRRLQLSIERLGPESVRGEFEQLDEFEILPIGAIDDLCERINCADTHPHISIHVSGGVVVDARANMEIVVDVFDEDSEFEDADDFDTAQSEHNSLPVEVY